MTDEQLRALVREAVARHLGGGDPRGAASLPHGAPASRMVDVLTHVSHGRYTLASGDESGSAGPCLIEPGVPCNHCGYCQSHGH